MENRSNQELKLLVDVFSGRTSSNRFGWMSALCAKKQPNAITKEEALELYLSNNEVGDVAQTTQEALLTYVSGETAAIGQELIDLKAILTTNKRWKIKHKQVEKILSQIQPESLSALERAYLTDLNRYVSENRALKAGRNIKIRNGIEQSISQLMPERPHTSETDTDYDILFADALRQASSSTSNRFEILTEAYTALNGESALGRKLLRFGKHLTSSSGWEERLQNAGTILQQNISLDLSEDDENYLRNALTYIENAGVNHVAPAVTGLATDLTEKIHDLLLGDLFTEEEMVETDDEEIILLDDKDIIYAPESAALPEETVPIKMARVDGLRDPVAEMLGAGSKPSDPHVIEDTPVAGITFFGEPVGYTPGQANVGSLFADDPVDGGSLFPLKNIACREYGNRIVKEDPVDYTADDSLSDSSVELVSPEDPKHPDLHKYLNRRVVAGLGAGAALLTVVGTLVALASTSKSNVDESLTMVSTNPPVVYVDAPKKEPAPKHALKAVQEQSDWDYCFDNLFDDSTALRKGSSIHTLSKKDLAEVTQRCFLDQARRIDPDLLKNVKISSSKYMQFPASADHVLVRTVMIPVETEGGREEVPLSYLDPMIDSSVMSPFGARRRISSPTRNSDGIYSCPEGQFRMARKPRAVPEDDPVGSKMTYVDATHIQPLGSIDGLVSEKVPESVPITTSDTPDISDSVADKPNTKSSDKAKPTVANTPSDDYSDIASSTAKARPRKRATKARGPNFACYKKHMGLDLKPTAAGWKTLRRYRTPMYPVLPGRVKKLVKGGIRAGDYVVVEHENGITSEYMHMDRFTPRLDCFFPEQRRHAKNREAAKDCKADESIVKSRTGSRIEFKDGQGPVVLPHVFEELTFETDPESDEVRNPLREYLGGEFFVGFMGHTGNADVAYPHLHLYVKHDGKYVDPERLLPVNKHGIDVIFNESHEAYLADVSKRVGVLPYVVRNMRGIETGHKGANMRAKSRKGAVGFMQVMHCAVSMARAQCRKELNYFVHQKKSLEGVVDETSRDKSEKIQDNIDMFSYYCDMLSSDMSWHFVKTDPLVNMFAGVMVFKRNLDRFGGDYLKAIAGYNAGPGAVEKAMARASRIDQSLDKRIHKSEISGNVQGLIQLRQQKKKNSWINFIYSGTRHYVHRAMKNIEEDDALYGPVESPNEQKPAKYIPPKPAAPSRTGPAPSKSAMRGGNHHPARRDYHRRRT
ncbi:transglycosylase SLT domain-containing protein [Nanoarchaeota archaeon]